MKNNLKNINSLLQTRCKNLRLPRAILEHNSFACVRTNLAPGQTSCSA